VPKLASFVGWCAEVTRRRQRQDVAGGHRDEHRLRAIFDQEALLYDAARASEGTVYSPPDPRRESPHGVYGLATEGSRERGEGIVQAVARALAAYLERFAES
jgi:creatinine amidohydrolase/Fe(II)-dependent formamide hydrolase-like protein